MERAQKAEAIKVIRDRFDRMSSAVFLDFTGMTVEEVSKLRDVFRAKGIEYKVVKNKLVQQALVSLGASRSRAPLLASSKSSSRTTRSSR
jgi:ribosomal protein L10